MSRETPFLKVIEEFRHQCEIPLFVKKNYYQGKPHAHLVFAKVRNPDSIVSPDRRDYWEEIKAYLIEHMPNGGWKLSRREILDNDSGDYTHYIEIHGVSDFTFYTEQ